MKTMFMLFGSIMLSTITVQESKAVSMTSLPQKEIAYQNSTKGLKLIPIELSRKVSITLNKAESNIASIDEIEYVEVEDEIDLGFDPKDYLPNDFDAHEIYVDIEQFEFVEMEEPSIELNMPILSDDFDAYTNIIELESISYIDLKKEQNEILDFDPKAYLPKNFDPFVSSKKEEETQMAFGALYLPEDFDPYTNVIDMEAMNYIAIEDENELDFDTSRYLPRDFDPYKK